MREEVVSLEFVLTEHHERWVKRACQKYRRPREYWRELIRRRVLGDLVVH